MGIFNNYYPSGTWSRRRPPPTPEQVAKSAARKAAKIGKREREFRATYPGLIDAMLESQHRIVKDILINFGNYGSLTPRQVELVNKLLQDEKRPRKQFDDGPKCSALTGRMQVTAEVLCVKDKETGLKMLLKIGREQDEAYWKAWGSVPRVLDVDGIEGVQDVEKGDTIEMTATFGRRGEPPVSSITDDSFTFFSRPTGARIVKKGERQPKKEIVRFPARGTFSIRKNGQEICSTNSLFEVDSLVQEKYADEVVCLAEDGCIYTRKAGEHEITREEVQP